MKLIKIAGSELNQTPLDWEGNKSRIIKAIEDAKKQEVSLLCLPELCISGYGCEDAFYASHVHELSLKILLEIKAFTQGIIVSVGLPVLFQNRIFNTACLIVNTEIVGFAAKRNLAGNGIHYEPRWFTPWPEEKIGHLTVDHKAYPIGDLYFNIGGVKIGFEICEDAWVSSRPGRKLYQFGVDLILNPSASHFAFSKLEVRKRFVLDGSRAFGVGYIYTNLLGNESGRAIFDGGTLIAANGTLLASGQRLTFADHHIVAAEIDLDTIRLEQAQSSSRFDFTEENIRCIRHPFQFPHRAPSNQRPTELPWEKSPYLQEEEFARALALGLFDYMRKSRSKGFVVSLSGGADSSAVTVCCYLMIRLAIDSIGLTSFKQKLNYIKELAALQTVEDIARLLICTVYQPTENSGPVTLEASTQLAKTLGTEFHVFEVDSLFKGYCSVIEKALKRPLSWEQDDVALQNIQARVRAPSVWMMANIKGALLLATSNRSEAAVGYATMDGDTSGGLSPIAGIDKAFLRQWLVWMETIGLNGNLAIPVLKLVNQQQPTAELRPPSATQTDEADLMPYDILEAIEEAAIRDKKSPIDCYLTLKSQQPEATSAQLKSWVSKFFRLWSRNQWKRERYAPSFHLDDKNLDPKTWCRFPILSGGFEYELKELEAFEG